MADFLDLTETELISFAQNFAVTLAKLRNRTRYKAAYVYNDVVTTDWSATLTVIAHS